MHVSGAKPSNVSQAMAIKHIATTLFVIIGVLLGSDGLSDDQTLSHRMIDEGGLQRVCNHRVQAGVLAGTKHKEQDISGTILAVGDQAGLLEAGLETRLIGDDVLHVRHVVVVANDVRPMPAGHGVVAVRVHHVQTALRATNDWACLKPSRNWMTRWKWHSGRVRPRQGNDKAVRYPDALSARKDRRRPLLRTLLLANRRSYSASLNRCMILDQMSAPDASRLNYFFITKN